MPRNARCVWPGLAYHITQRGTNRQRVFYSIADRKAYLQLLGDGRTDAGVRVLAYCLMTNHVHLVAVAERPDSLAVWLRRAHGRYAQYLNARLLRSGHLWQNRFFSCALEAGHQSAALRYVEFNPVRAAVAASPAEFRWSSAAAHLSGRDSSRLLDMDFWREFGGAEAWAQMLATPRDVELEHCVRAATHGGRPLGGDAFLRTMEERFARVWRRPVATCAIESRALRQAS